MSYRASSIRDKGTCKQFAGGAVAIVLALTIQVAADSTDLFARSDAASSAKPVSASALDLSGKTVNPFQVAQGKPLVLVFVRTDCPISNRYAPTIEALNKKYAGAVVMMLVYPDKSETPANIEKHLREYGYQLTPLRDTQHNLVKLGKVEITPEVAVFNSEQALIYHGRIDNWYKTFGQSRPAPTTHELDEAIQAALNRSHAAPAPVGGIGCYISDLQ